MSSTSYWDLLFVFELHRQISDLQEELTRVMNDPNPHPSERDALRDSIAELKKAVMTHMLSTRRKSADATARRLRGRNCA
jgi:hypothetical protein